MFSVCQGESNMLRWHVCRVNFARKIFIELRIFLRKMLRNFPLRFRNLCSVGQKKARKIPAKFPCKKYKKFTDELLQERNRIVVTILCHLCLHFPAEGSCGHFPVPENHPSSVGNPTISTGFPVSIHCFPHHETGGKRDAKWWPSNWCTHKNL